MTNRYILIILVLLMVTIPVVDARNQSSDYSLIALVTHDIVIEAISWTSFPIFCLEGDTLSGEFQLTSDGDLFPGDQTKYDNWLLGGVDFFILDDENYDLWVEESTAGPIFERESLIELEWSIEIPSSGTWYVVYSNDSIFMKQIEGSIERTSPHSIFFLLIGIAGVVLIVTFIIGYVLIPRWKK